MFLTVHSTVGAVIGESTGNIYLALLAGLVSHVILDIIPHGDRVFVLNRQGISFRQKLEKLAIIDLMIMTPLFIFLYQNNFFNYPLPVFAGIIGSIAPDFVTGLYLLTHFPFLKKFLTWHRNLHDVFEKYDKSYSLGFLIQFVVTVIFLTIIIL